MAIVRHLALLFCLCLAVPAPAQTDAQIAPQPRPDDIVVNARIEPKSAWKRAETDHVVLYSTGSDGELKRIARNLESLHVLLSKLYRRGDTSDDVLPVQITLIDSVRHWQDMGLTETRSQEGPFPGAFAARLYFDPREDGDVLAVAQADQPITLDTSRRFNLECDKYLAGGGEGMCGKDVTPPLPLVREWEAVLYATFARRFLLAYTPAAYPRWYLDGLGALFSTIEVKRSGAVDYAQPPAGYKAVLQSYGYPQMHEILTGRYLAAPQAAPEWSPYGAWLLVHYFVFSKLTPERSQQFAAYMTAIRQGTPMAEAAAVFGDMGRLQRDIQRYADAQIAFAHADPPPTAAPEPLVTALSLARGALVEARVELGSRPTSDLLGQARAVLAQHPGDGDALTFLAELACRGGQPDDCLAAADRALATAPDDVAALAWRGVALTDLAVAGPPAERTTRLVAARRTIERAMQLGGAAPRPLIAYFESFTKAAEPASEMAIRGLTTVIRGAPAAPGPRLLLSQELVRQGQADLARRLLVPVLYGAYESSEKSAAQHLFATTGAITPAAR